MLLGLVAELGLTLSDLLMVPHSASVLYIFCSVCSAWQTFMSVTYTKQVILTVYTCTAWSHLLHEDQREAAGLAAVLLGQDERVEGGWEALPLRLGAEPQSLR